MAEADDQEFKAVLGCTSSQPRLNKVLSQETNKQQQAEKTLAGDVAKLAECLPGMQETMGSIPGMAQIRHGGGMLTCTCKPSRDWESQEFKVILTTQ